jgi:hypothetical protein
MTVVHTLDIFSNIVYSLDMETTTQEASTMTATQTRTEQIYAELKLIDRMTPGRTPWQTLLRRAEELAAAETLTDADRVA